MAMGDICPFTQQNCIKDECRLYNSNRKTCRIEDIELHLFEIRKWLNK